MLRSRIERKGFSKSLKRGARLLKHRLALI